MDFGTQGIHVLLKGVQEYVTGIRILITRKHFKVLTWLLMNRM